MKPRVLLALFCIIPFSALLAEKDGAEAPERLSEPSPFSALQGNSKTETDRPSDVSIPPESSRANRRMPTSEELEKVRKDRNWMVEGMKERQAAAKPSTTPDAQSSTSNPYGPNSLQNPANMDMSQSIIDMVLNKNKKQTKSEPAKELKPMEIIPAGQDPAARSNSGENTSSNAFKPVISTNSFDTANASRTTGEKNTPSTFLQRERAQARQAGFKETQGFGQTQDALANPFANLPIPEDALPQAQPRFSQPPPTGVSATYMPSAGNPAVQNTLSGTMASAAGPGNPSPATGAAPAVTTIESNPAAPRFAVEQPYTILREQELVRQLQQQKNNSRPKVQDLRSLVRDPNEARLF